jgi:hypothetical protein
MQPLNKRLLGRHDQRRSVDLIRFQFIVHC